MFRKYLAMVLAIMWLSVLPQISEAAKYACRDSSYGGKEAKFVMLIEDEVNFREQPETGRVIKEYDNHTLFRVIKEKGEWLEVESTYGRGFIFKAKTGALQEEELLEEDFELPFAKLNDVYDEANLIEKLGKLTDKQQPLKKLYATFGMVELEVDTKGYITRIVSKDKQLITMRGLTVGDSENRLVGQYGAPATVEYGVNSNVYTYYFRPNELYLFSMIFDIDNDNHIQSITWSVMDKPTNEKRVKLKKRKQSK